MTRAREPEVLATLRAIDTPLPDLTRGRAWRALERRLDDPAVRVPAEPAGAPGRRARVVVAVVAAVAAAAAGLALLLAGGPGGRRGGVDAAPRQVAPLAPAPVAAITVARIDRIDVAPGDRLVRDWRGVRLTVIGPAEVELIGAAHAVAAVRRGVVLAERVTSASDPVVLETSGGSWPVADAVTVRVVDQRTEVAVGRSDATSFIERLDVDLGQRAVATPAELDAPRPAPRHAAPAPARDARGDDPEARYARAEQLLRTGDVERARPLLIGVAGAGDRRLADGARIDLARLALSAGRPAEAGRWLDEVAAADGTALAVAAARLRQQLLAATP